VLILSNGNFEVAPIVFAGGDGSSFDEAIVILGATKATGVDAEYLYLGNHFPGFQLQCQRMQPRDNKNYDVLEIVTPDGTEHNVYFNITGFLPFQNTEF
jgi:hypothetical protein